MMWKKHLTKLALFGVPVMAQCKLIWRRSLALLSGLRIRCCLELWCRSQMQLGPSDVALLWLWHNPAAASPSVPSIRFLCYRQGSLWGKNALSSSLRMGVMEMIDYEVAARNHPPSSFRCGPVEGPSASKPMGGTLGGWDGQVGSRVIL